MELGNRTDKLAQAERTYLRLRDAIVTCKVPAGARLAIKEISEQEQVSPGAVREALSRLSTEHLVVALHQRGFRVAPLSRDDMNDLYLTRARLEGSLVANSVRIGKPNWIADVKAKYEKLGRPGSFTTIGPEAAQAHEDFHWSLVAGCESDWSLRLFETLYTASERYRHFAYRNIRPDRDIHGEHKAIFLAAINRDADLAEQLIVDHVSSTRRLLNDLLTAPSEAASPEGMAVI